jgi:hypothetical protein
LSTVLTRVVLLPSDDFILPPRSFPELSLDRTDDCSSGIKYFKNNEKSKRNELHTMGADVNKFKLAASSSKNSQRMRKFSRRYMNYCTAIVLYIVFSSRSHQDGHHSGAQVTYESIPVLWALSVS